MAMRRLRVICVCSYSSQAVRRVLAIMLKYVVNQHISKVDVIMLLISDGGSHLDLQSWRPSYLLVIRSHIQYMPLVTRSGM